MIAPASAKPLQELFYGHPRCQSGQKFRQLRLRLLQLRAERAGAGTGWAFLAEPCIGTDRQVASGFRENNAFCAGRPDLLPDWSVKERLKAPARQNPVAQCHPIRQSCLNRPSLGGHLGNVGLYTSFAINCIFEKGFEYMALDYVIDLNVSLHMEEKYKSLYVWSLKETKENGDQVGPDLIPYRSDIFFHSTSFGINRSISSQYNFRLDDEDLEALKFTKTDVIVANLVPGAYDDDHWRAPSISMIGSSRSIKDIRLFVFRIDDPAKENCVVRGIIASEIDFCNERIESMLQIRMYFSDEKFDSLFDLIRYNQIDRLWLRLSDVEGFYSDYRSLPGSNNFIKVLGSLKDHGLEVDEEWKKLIPTLGRVGEASIEVQRIQTAKLEKPS
ncbi:hypothetical protein [Novosphingobium acidiphilum]|uniref:hypothetical protein n=1 Tax=Novosphingobium acidiphilum TaxID=505248 RepID=UPI0012ECAA66|nr:hypothetical protein [Novosphingobium acidiphilum]